MWTKLWTTVPVFGFSRQLSFVALSLTSCHCIICTFVFFLTWSNQMEINGNAAVKTSPSQSPLTSTVVTGAPTWASCDRNPSVMWSHSFSSMNTNVSRSSVKDGGLFCWNSLRSRFFLRDNFYFNFKFRQKQPNLTSPVVTLGDDTTYKQTT